MNHHGSESSTAQPGSASAKQARLDKGSPFTEAAGHRRSPRGNPPSSSRTPISPPPLRRPFSTSGGKLKSSNGVNWTADQLMERLTSYRQDMGTTYGQLAKYAIESNTVVDRRIHTGKDLFSSVSLDPVPRHKDETLRIKIKHLGKHLGTDREEHYNAICIQTVKKPVPLYYNHPVEVEKNVVASQTPMAFYPYKGDTDTAEKQKKQDEYFKELNEVDNHQLGPIKLDQKRGVVIHSERVAQVSMYLETWLDDLAIPGLNKWSLWLSVPLPNNHRPRTREQISSITEHCGDIDDDLAFSHVKLFSAAWDQVFKEERTRQGVLLAKIELFDVLCYDGEIKAALNPRPVPRMTSATSKGEEFDAFESKLETYSSLGCLICFRHSCEHGFYTDDNSRERFSLEKGWLARRLADNLKTMASRQQNNPTSDLEAANDPCDRRCYFSENTSERRDTPARDWTSLEHHVLRAIFMSATSSLDKADPICHTAALLDRDCFDVHREFQNLSIPLPIADSAAASEEIPNLTWYNRHKKKLSKRHGAAKYHMPNWDHINREIDDVCALRGCDHDGPCEPGNKDCPCANKGQLCEKFCGCSVENCAFKFTGCDCRSQGKSCDVKGEDCICIQLNRECDPDLCGSCGVIERADPANARDEELHLTGCQNCSLQRGIAKKLVLGNSQFHGFGLFAAEDIKKDQFIIEYVGELVSGEEGDRRYIRRQNVFEDSKPLSFNFTLLKECNVWVDGARYGNLSRYINHAVGSSHKCNVTPKILLVNGGFRIAFRAKRNIKAWEELLFDYGEDFGIDSDKEKDKKHGQSHKTARKNAPVGSDRSEVESNTDSEVEPSLDGMDFMDTLPEPTSTRKRKRGIYNESEEDIYEPTGSDDGLMGSQDSEAGPRQSTRLRFRGKPSPLRRREGVATRKERGRPRKNRAPPVSRPTSAPTSSSESPVGPGHRGKRRRLSKVIEISDSEDGGRDDASDPRPATAEGGRRRDTEESKPSAEESELDEVDYDEDDEDLDSSQSPRRDQPVRNRRQPAKFKDDEIYGLRPKKRRRRKDMIVAE